MGTGRRSNGVGVEREAKKRRAVEVKVKSQEKALEVTFDDGTRFRYPAEFLRVFSPSAEVKGHMPGQEKVSLVCFSPLPS